MQLDHYKRVAHSTLKVQVPSSITSLTPFDAIVVTEDILCCRLEDLYIMAKFGGFTENEYEWDWIYARAVRIVMERKI